MLVGYSGGGNVAALLAARRPDVVRLVTVAGNLDHVAWAHHHRAWPLQGSLNAADRSDSVRNLPQTHFVGAKDRVMPVELARNWAEGFLGERQRNLHIIPDYDHQCCWADHWARLFP